MIVFESVKLNPPALNANNKFMISVEVISVSEVTRLIDAEGAFLLDAIDTQLITKDEEG